jgi:universal stress protein A
MNSAQTNLFEERMPIGLWEEPHPSFPYHIEKILVPVDFSELSKKALRYAIPLARCTGARMIVINVVPGQRYQVGAGLIASPEFEAGRWRNVDERERQLVDLCRSEIGRDPKSEAIVQVGKPEREIVNAAEAWDVDLIIMATHGLKGVKRVLKSNTAQKVIAQAPCAVLVVQEHGHELIPA